MIEIHTQRFVLRPFEAEDADDYYAKIFADESVTATMTGIHHIPDRDSVDDMIVVYRGFWADNAFGPLVIEDKQTGAFVGSCGLTNYRVPAEGELELVVTLARSYRGQQIAAEVIAAWLRYAFETLELQRVVAFAYPDDVAADQMLRRGGMVRLHHTTITEEVVTTYVMTRDDYDPPGDAPYEVRHL